MNTIPQDQNMPRQLQRLAAQRELYSAAKRMHVAQIIFTVVVPVGLAIIALITKQFATPAAIYGLSTFLFDIGVLEPAIKKTKTKAAKIQELFDCDVLQLAPSPLKTVSDIKVEEVLVHYNAHAKIASNIEKIKNWYPVNIDVLPIEVARLICQRSNCWWDSNLRERYARFLKIFGISVLSLIILVGIVSGMTVTQLALVGSGLVPFFRFCIRNCNDNKDAAQRLNELVSYSRQLWNEALTGNVTEQDLASSSRRLQDEIYEHRRRSPLILDIYYKQFRDKDEELMNVSSKQMIEEAIAKIVN